MTAYALVVLGFGCFGFLVLLAIRHRDRWIPAALRRDAKGLDAQDMDEGFAHKVVPADQDARDKGAV